MGLLIVKRPSIVAGNDQEEGVISHASVLVPLGAAGSVEHFDPSRIILSKFMCLSDPEKSRFRAFLGIVWLSFRGMTLLNTSFTGLPRRRLYNMPLREI